MHNENQSFKNELLEQLAPILHKVTLEYKNYSENKLSFDAKSFSTYQSDCKSALTHLHLLIKFYLGLMKKIITFAILIAKAIWIK